MEYDFKESSLWKSTLAKREPDPFEKQREFLRSEYEKFRINVGHMVADIGAQLPNLTVHDITHLDALWGVASEIAGADYELTPAEAFVLGGAILLHDSAHAIAAYPDGKAGIKKTPYWNDLVAQRYNGKNPEPGTPEENAAIFMALRHLHAKQAATLHTIQWRVPGTNSTVFLLEDLKLRQGYGALIGRVAESHHWNARQVVTQFDSPIHTAQCGLPVEWTVDALKVAFLLRTADAAHIDGGRAPWFLFALRKPEGISEKHWLFQAKIGRPTYQKDRGLQISATDGFPPAEREAWWLAYDTVQMIDRELRDAHGLMQDYKRPLFQARSVLGAGSPESFARYVRPTDWEPVDVAPKISNVNKIIEMLGGRKLYGDRPDLAVRELLQNAIDAIHAKRALGGLGPEEGEIVVSLDTTDDGNYRLSVTDNGIGMSKYVLTNVLLDFGNSLWKSDALREHLPGLASTGFQSAGQFGIGFFSVFMLGEKILVVSQARQGNSGMASGSYSLDFHDGLKQRPVLSQSSISGDDFSGGGTRVSVEMPLNDARKIFGLQTLAFAYLKRPNVTSPAVAVETKGDDIVFTNETFAHQVLKHVPMSDVRIRISFNGSLENGIEPNDWITIPDEQLSRRVGIQMLSNSFKPLYPVKDEGGTVLGRMRMGDQMMPRLALTHCGIVCGTAEGLHGALQAVEPMNAARTSARVVIPHSSWSQWATLVVAAELDQSAPERLLQLATLLPDSDLPIYRLADETVNLEKLKHWLGEHGEILVHRGTIYPTMQDHFSHAAFFNHFEPHDNVLIIPSVEIPDLWKSQFATPYDPGDKFEKAVTSVWGKYTQVADSREVGTVDGATMQRQLLVLTRAL